MKLSRYPLWPQNLAPHPGRREEEDRARVIAAHGLDAVEDDAELERLVNFVAKLCEVPIALVTVVEKERQRFLARIGTVERETPRPTSFCAHAMLGTEPMQVPDATADPRFADNPLVTGEPHIRFYAGAPLISSEGVPLGALCVIDSKPRPEGLSELQVEGLTLLADAVMRRLTFERHANAAERQLSLSEQRVRQLAEHLPVYAWAANEEGALEYANPALFEFCGTEDVASIDLDSLAHPDNVEEIVEARRRSREERSRWEIKAQMRRHDGAYRWMVLRAWPVKTGKREPDTWFGAAVDIDDLHRLSESRDLLARELSHRIKNIFAVVSGLIAVRVRNHSDAEVFAEDLQATITALGRAHDYVRPFEGRKGNSLHGLLEDLLEPYGNGRDDRIAIIGDDCPIGDKAATPLALVFHELATNSAKYGALSRENGSVAIRISSDDRHILADWSERGLKAGETTAQRDHEGFGSRLLRLTVEGQLAGKYTRTFSGDTLEVALAFSREAMESGLG